MRRNDPPCQILAMLVGAAPESRASVSGCVTAWDGRGISETYLTESRQHVVIVASSFSEGVC